MSITESIFARHGSDKTTIHRYQRGYDLIVSQLLELGSPFEAGDWHFLEVGYFKGGSAVAWREIFPYFTHHSLDIKFPENIPDWLDCLRCNTDDEAALAEVAKRLPERAFPLVVDDGSHLHRHQVQAINAFWPLVAPGGFYVIEDLQKPEDARAFAGFPGYMLIDTRYASNRYDDLMVVLQKPR